MIKYINIFILQLACSFGRAIIYTLTFLSAHLQKKSFQETTQYLEIFMLLHAVIMVVIKGNSFFKQYFKEVDL